MSVVERGTGRGFNAADYLLFYVFKGKKKLPASNLCLSPASLQAAVVLNPRYPEVSPLFSLCLSWKGERSGQTDDNLRVRLASVMIAFCHT